MTTAEIIAIGTELLLGETVDSNTSFIARTIRELGINVFRTHTVGDNVARIAASMKELLKRGNLVISTGGLGPTVDDVSREAAAWATNRKLQFSPELWKNITRHLTGYGRMPSENQKKQAYLPTNALHFDNPVGTAPAFLIEYRKRLLICLPGVPREMEKLLAISILPYLREKLNIHETILVRTLHAGGVGEGFIDEKICDLEYLSNPIVGLSAQAGIVSIRITGKSNSYLAAKEKIKKIEVEVRVRLGDNFFGVDKETLEVVTLNELEKRGWTLACVEFQNHGLLQLILSKSSRSTFKGGYSVSDMGVPMGTLIDNEMERKTATTGLGIACFTEGGKMTTEIIIHRPSGQIQKKLEYGGSPEDFYHWNSNMALDLLRRYVRVIK